MKGERTPFVEGHCLSREGHSLSTREGERCKSTREDESKVVGRKNNEFPRWEIQHSTYSHDVGVSTDLNEKLRIAT